jgi:hypothetical protein
VAVDGPVVEGGGELRPADGAADLAGPSCRLPGDSGIRAAQRVVHIRSRSAGASRGDSACSGTSRLHAGSQLTSPASSTGKRQRREPAQGVRGHVRQGLDRFGDDPAPAQQRLPPRDADQFLRGRAGRQPTQVEPDDAVTGRRQRRRGDRGAGSPAVVAQVDQPHSPHQDPAQVVGEPPGVGVISARTSVSAGVRVVGPQQVRGDAVRHAQAAGEERALRLLDGHEQVLHQRRPRGQPPRAAAAVGRAAPISRASPTVARRRVTSSLR